MVMLVWAMTSEGIIGSNNKLPWKIKSEMQYFQKITMNQTVLMGAKTFVSIGKPLKNRYNIVITRHREHYENDFSDANVIFSDDLPAMLNQYHNDKTRHLYVIGGADIYRQSWPKANYLYVSIIKKAYAGDVKFPQCDFEAFNVIATEEYDEFTVKVYERKD